MMSNKRAAALKALGTVKALHPDFHGPILSALADAGVVEPNDGGEVIHAAAGKTRLEKIEAAVESNPSSKAALAYGLGRLRSHGIVIDDFLSEDDAVTMVKLDKCMAAKSIDANQRMDIKTALARASVLA